MATAEQCPQWDSNPHCADFKSAASANWAIGALQFSAYFLATQLRLPALRTAVIPQRSR